MRMQDGMHFVLDPRPVPDELIAARNETTLALRHRIRRPDLRQVARRIQARQRARINLVGLHMRMRDRLHLQRIGDHHPRHERRQHARHRHAVARRLGHDRIGRTQALAEAFQRCPGHIDPAGMPELAVFPNYHLAKGSVDIHSDHTSHRFLLSA
jgi:hypothetical protein